MTGKQLVPSDPVEGLIEKLREVQHHATTAKQRGDELEVATEIVFRYWQAKMNKTNRVLFDEKRQRCIKARLAENGGDVSELLYAIDGARRDDWCMGRCDNSRRKYNGVQHIFRDREQVETWVENVGKVQEIHPLLRDHEETHD